MGFGNWEEKNGEEKVDDKPGWQNTCLSHPSVRQEAIPSSARGEPIVLINLKLLHGNKRLSEFLEE